MAEIVEGFAQILTLESVALMILGITIGVVVGALPGLTATMAIALLLPVTFTMPPLLAIPFLIGVYRGGLHGGVITAILIGVPGNPVNVPTLLDGHKLAQQGYPRTALRAALYASVAGAVIAALLLITLIGPVSRAALAIGSPELFALLVFSMTLVSFISGKRLAYGWAAAGLGMALGMVGVDPVVGSPRFTFGISSLLGGMPIIPLFIGLFALPELVGLVERHHQASAAGELRSAASQVPRAADDDITFLQVVRRYWAAILSSSAVGSVIGVLPGVGSETSPWVAYGLRKKMSRRRDNFGEGEIEGVVAPEVANDAVASAGFIPTLIFGVPGDLPLAIMLGALMAQGLRPSPRLFVEQPEVMYGIIAAVFLCSVLLYVVVRPMTVLLSRVVDVPTWILVPGIAGLCFAGAYGAGLDPFNFVVLIGGGLLGIAMKAGEVPIGPLILAFVISPRLEQAFRESLMLDANILIFFRSPLSVLLLVLGVGVIVSAIIGRGKGAVTDAGRRNV